MTLLSASSPSDYRLIFGLPLQASHCSVCCGSLCSKGLCSSPCINSHQILTRESLSLPDAHRLGSKQGTWALSNGMGTCLQSLVPQAPAISSLPTMPSPARDTLPSLLNSITPQDLAQISRPPKPSRKQLLLENVGKQRSLKKKMKIAITIPQPRNDHYSYVSSLFPMIIFLIWLRSQFYIVIPMYHYLLNNFLSYWIFWW